MQKSTQPMPLRRVLPTGRTAQLSAGVLEAWRAQHGPEQTRLSGAARSVQTPARSKRSYGGAQFGRTTADWVSTSSSADTELVSSLRTLRNRSRQLCRDNEYAKSAKRTIMLNVVGRGVSLQAQVKKRRGDLFDDKINDSIEALWVHSMTAQRIHTGGKLSWARLLQMVIEGVFESGEVLVRIVRQKFGNSRVPFALEIIESDQIVETFSGKSGDNGNEIRMGVEVDQWQRPVAYWMYPRHPGDTMVSATVAGQSYVRVPADDIIHVARFERPYQTRGVPWMHATLLKLRHMGGYEEAEIVAARASAAIMGFRQKPEVDIPGDGADDADDVMDGERVTDMAPGVIMDLEPGETFTGFNPSRPNAALDPFMRYMLRSVAAGVGCSYESLSRDYSQSNYSSSRLALLDDRDLWRTLQDWLIETLCQPIYERWLEMAVLSGALNLPAYETSPEIYQAIRWAPRGWAWVDPVKEGSAARSDVRSGFRTLADVHAEQGDDFEDYCKRRQNELRLAKQYGLVLDTDPGQVNDKGQVQPDPTAAASVGAATEEASETPAKQAEEATSGQPDDAAEAATDTPTEKD